MAMTTAYLNALAGFGASVVRYIGLVDKSGTEVAGHGYSRLAVSWGSPDKGTVRPAADLTFTIPAGATVAGWRGYDAESGGTEFGGHDLPTEKFSGAGEYRLIAASTGIVHRG